MKGFGWRITGFCLVILIVALVLPTHSPGLKTQVDGAVVMVMALNDRQEITARGNGFFIDKAMPGEAPRQVLVTARHLLMGASRAEIRVNDSDSFVITAIIAEDRDADLVLCLTDAPAGACPSLPLATEIPEPGMDIVVANPQQRDGDGRLLAVRSVEGFGTLYQITRPIPLEASGTPVVNNHRQVIGMAVLSLLDGKDGHIVIPAARLMTLQPMAGKSLADWAPHAASDWESSADRLLLRGRALLAIGEPEKARICFEQVARSDPANTAAKSGLAICAGGHPDAGRSSEALNGMKTPGYDAADLSIAAGEAFNQAGHFEDAVKVLLEALQTKPDSARIYIDLGIAYSNLHRDSEALEAFKYAIRLDPGEPAAQLDLGLCYRKLQHPVEAEAAFKEAIRIKPDYADAYAKLGILYLDLGRSEQALDVLKQVVKYDAKDHVSVVNLGIAYLRLKRNAEAGAILREEARRYPEDTQVHYLLGVAGDGSGQSDVALKEFKEAVRLDPKNALAYRALGLLNNRLQQYPEALQAFREAVRLDPSDADSQARYGALCIGAKQYPEAVLALEEVVKINPKDAVVQGNLGLAYLNLKRYDEAVEAFQTVIRLDPRQPLAYHSLGRAYGYLHRYGEAETVLKEAIRLDPRRVEAHYDLGINYIYLKDRMAAWGEYNILKLLDKPSAAALLKRIDQFLPEK